MEGLGERLPKRKRHTVIKATEHDGDAFKTPSGKPLIVGKFYGFEFDARNHQRIVTEGRSTAKAAEKASEKVG